MGATRRVDGTKRKGNLARSGGGDYQSGALTLPPRGEGRKPQHEPQGDDARTAKRGGGAAVKQAAQAANRKRAGGGGPLSGAPRRGPRAEQPTGARRETSRERRQPEGATFAPEAREAGFPDHGRAATAANPARTQPSRRRAPPLTLTCGVIFGKKGGYYDPPMWGRWSLVKKTLKLRLTTMHTRDMLCKTAQEGGFRFMAENLRKTKQHSINLAPHITAKLEQMAAEKGVPKASIVSLALDEYFRKEESRDK